MFGSKRGYTLPLTIVILLIIGFLSFSFYDMVKRERMESFRRYGSAYASLEFESAANYAFYRMATAKEPWRTDSLRHSSKDGKIQFIIRQVQDGAFARLTVCNRDSSKTFSSVTGYIPKARPALVVTAPQTSVALVGDARVEGGTALKSGRINYSTNYKNRASKDAFYDTAFVGDTLPYFDTLKYYPELSRKSFDTTFNRQSCIFDGTDALPEELRCATVVMQGDSRCNECRISADRIFIRGRSSLTKANVIARTISFKDSATAGGFFLARDSMEIDLKLEQKSKVWFSVQGQRKTETEYVGKLSVQKLKATNAALLFLGDNWDETQKGIPVEITDKVDVTGTLVANGVVDFRGKLKGHMTVSNFSFYEGETLWRGFLKNGQIKGDTAVHILLPDIIHFGGDPSYE